METVVPILSALLPSIPLFAVYLFLIIVAVSRWERHPRVSMFAVSGLGLELFLTIVGRTVFTLLPMYLRENGQSMASIGMLSTGISVVLTVFHAIAVGLIGAAIFVERRA